MWGLLFKHNLSLFTSTSVIFNKKHPYTNRIDKKFGKYYLIEDQDEDTEVFLFKLFNNFFFFVEFSYFC